jgi:hypothetical protein
MTGDIKAVQALLGHAAATMTLYLDPHLLTLLTGLPTSWRLA